MNALTLGLVLAALSGLPCFAAAPSMDMVNGATFKDEREAGIEPMVLRAQVLLDRLHISPGAIDGRESGNFDKAVAAFRKAEKLPFTGPLDRATWDRLVATSPVPALFEYEITEADVKGPFLEVLPERMEAMAGLERLAYTSVREMLAERFHMNEDLLAELNIGRAFSQPGTKVVVAKVRAAAARSDRVARIEVDTLAGDLRAYDEAGALVAFYPASVGSADEPTPTGSHQVSGVVTSPGYTYNPQFRFKDVASERAFTIAPGPNNPVGSAWIALTAKTYGIHGTPDPDLVGTSQSHGCVRLTNWDVLDLANMVRRGTRVVFPGEGTTSLPPPAEHRASTRHVTGKAERRSRAAKKSTNHRHGRAGRSRARR
jgi:lipoprotein-anchoring transpeptidase ErfK/SrfK